MQFPSIDPIFLSIGPLHFRWYGLMYVLSFIASYFILRAESHRKKLSLATNDIADLLFYGIVGVILGGRVGFIIWTFMWLTRCESSLFGMGACHLMAVFWVSLPPFCSIPSRIKFRSSY